MDKEPVLVSVLAGNVAGVLINLAIAFHVPVSDDQKAAIIAAVQTGATTVGAVVGRHFAWSPDSHANEVTMAELLAKNAPSNG